MIFALPIASILTSVRVSLAAASSPLLLVIGCIEYGQWVLYIAGQGMRFWVDKLVHHAWNEVTCVGDDKGVGHDSGVGNDSQYAVPGTYILDSLRQRPSSLCDHFVGVQANLSNVVQECEERSQRKCGHKECYKAILENFLKRD